MTTLEELTDAMWEHEAMYSPRLETEQWRAFSEVVRRKYGVDPTEPAAAVVVVDEDFAAYWRAVARREWERAALFGDVPAEWRE